MRVTDLHQVLLSKRVKQVYIEMKNDEESLVITTEEDTKVKLTALARGCMFAVISYQQTEEGQITGKSNPISNGTV